MASAGVHLRRAGTLSIVLASVLLGLAPGAASASDLEACAPSAEVTAALDRIPSSRVGYQSYAQFSEQRIGGLRTLRSRFPGDLFVERTYVEFLSRMPSRSDLIEEYRALHEQHPDDPRLAYLYGLTLFGLRTPEATALFEAALAKAPAFPWPHLALVSVYTAPRFLNREKSAANLRDFLDRCPGVLEGYGRVELFDDPETVRQATQSFRRLVQSRRDTEALAAYRTLWALEFRTQASTEHDRQRDRVAADLKRIRSLRLKDRKEWYETLVEGYRLLDDQPEADRLAADGQRRFPHPWDQAPFEVWARDHPQPAPEAPAEEKRAYDRALVKQSDVWMKRLPGNALLWIERLDALDRLDDAPAADVESAVERTVTLSETYAGSWGADPGTYFDGAKALVMKGLRPEKVVELARKGLDQMDAQAGTPVSDLILPERTSELEFDDDLERVGGIALEIEGYLALRQTERARRELVQLDERLQKIEALAGERVEPRRQWSAEKSEYWSLSARLAEIENRRVDAMSLYQNALLARLESRDTPETGERDVLADGARRLWDALGGTPGGWQDWYGRRAAALETTSRLTWESSQDPLPAFEIVDLAGRTWRSSDLKGKVTLLNVWASW